MAINDINKHEVIKNAKEFFKKYIVESHIKNTEKLTNLSEFNINPFLTIYLANFLSGYVDSKTIAKALIYPRVLGSSITTSFGSNIQKFCSSVLPGIGSTTPGIDIEFIDQKDNRKKYCQIKAGPNTINKDDVITIVNHFKSMKNQARVNSLPVHLSDMIVGVLYGTNNELSSHYKTIDTEHHHPVFIGQEFWSRLTGDENFYYDLINAIIEVAEPIEKKENENTTTELLDKVIKKLAQEIEQSETFKAYLNKNTQL